jgi:hypothetical protein
VIVDTLEYVGTPKTPDLQEAERFGEQFARGLLTDR